MKGGYRVLQKSVAWETGVDWRRRKGVLLLEIFYCYKGISEGWSGWVQRALEVRCVGDWCGRKGVLLLETSYYYKGISKGWSGCVQRAPKER